MAAATTGPAVAEATRDEQLDLIARTLRDARTGRSTPATDEEWARSKDRFRTTYRTLLEEAERILADGTLHDE